MMGDLPFPFSDGSMSLFFFDWMTSMLGTVIQTHFYLVVQCIIQRERQVREEDSAGTAVGK